jgi:acetoin utilization deacetylase AcuC-like enzyme
MVNNLPGLCYDDCFLQHNTGEGNIYLNLDGVLLPEIIVENSWRLKQMITILKNSGLQAQMQQIPFKIADYDQIGLVHTEEYIKKIEALSASGSGDAGDGGTPIDSTSYTTAAYAVGAALAAVDAVMDQAIGTAYCLIRPPGHHAKADSGMGFCIFNNASIAAKYALTEKNAKRIMIVDWDAHHGNGTEAIFWESPEVLTVSIHQDSLYPPGSGALTDIGSGAGRGYNVNIPLPAGSGNQAYWRAWDDIVEPLAEKYRPDLLIISAGQDASVFDTLARMAVTANGFRGLGERASIAAKKYANNNLILLQEGGYNSTYSAFCCMATIEGVTGLKGNIEDPFAEQFDNIPAQIINSEQKSIIRKTATLVMKHI